MITWRKITAEGAGKLIVAYLREHQLQAEQPEQADRAIPASNPNIDSGARMNSYYTGRDGKGAWAPQMGSRIAGALGIDPAQAPSDEGLARLFEGKRADNGEKWAGEHAKRTLSAIDFTASPDKSVTLAAEFASTKAEQAMIWLAIHRANDRAMNFITREIGVARRGRGGQSSAENGETAWVSFRHYAARPAMSIQDGPDGATGIVEIPVPGDPQAHIHNLMFNAVATESGHLGSLDMARITRATSFMFGAYFQAELASELRAMGVQVTANESGRAIVIESIPKAACDLFSKRHSQAAQMGKKYAKEQGLDWDTLSADRKFSILHHANLAYRSKKYDGTNDREIWQEQAAELGWHHETVLTNQPAGERSDAERYEEAYAIASRMLVEEFKTAAVVDRDIFRTHAAHGLIAAGIKHAEDVEHVAQLVEARGIDIAGERVHFVQSEQEGRLRVTTTEQLRVEKEMAALAGLSARTRAGALTEEAIAAAVARSGLDFTSEPAHGQAQLAAIRSLGLSGGLAFLTGVAGSGKTTLLRPLVDAWKNDGRRVIGSALAWRQTNALRDAGISEGYALSPLLKSLQSGSLQLDSKTVLVVDEISQVAPRQLLTLLEWQQKCGFSLRLLGDRGQAQAIEAGDTVELLLRVMPADARPELLSTVRQSTARGRSIAGMFRSQGRDPEKTEMEQREYDTSKAREALEMKRKDGTISFVGGDHEQVVADIADLYLRRRDAIAQYGGKRGITMSAPTNQDVMDLGMAVRDRLRARGEIASQEIVKPAIDQRGEKYDLPLAVGDRVRLFAKTSVQADTPYGKRWRDLGSNGDFVTVRGWSEKGLLLENDKGRLGLAPWDRLAQRDSGRILLGMGYAITIDAAQGVTSDEHINAMPRGSAAVTGFTSYVAESRHVHRCWTRVGEAAVREAEQWSRPLGDRSPVTMADLYNRLAADMGRHPYKDLAVDLVKVDVGAAEAQMRWIKQSHDNENSRSAGKTPGARLRTQQEERLLHSVDDEVWNDLSRTLRKSAYSAQNENEKRRAREARRRSAQGDLGREDADIGRSSETARPMHTGRGR